MLPTIEHNELFDLAYRFVTETGENIFLTGKAGTGKTTFLKYLKENCTKNTIVAAPTGVAAINASGVTLHSLFQLPFHPYLPTGNHKNELLAKIRYNKQRQTLLRKMELLVIDEISMVRCDVLDAIDTILKSIRRNHQQPFGGVQVLFIGDLHQLPPVAQQQEWKILGEYYESPFFFDSQVCKTQLPLLIELNKIYRQKEDSFVNLLNKVRNNEMDEDDFEMLHERFIPGFRPEAEEGFITLTSHNNQADQINQQQLHRLLAAPFLFKARIENDFPEHMYPAEAELILKAGAQVMFIKNDAVQKRYFNGKIGTVRLLEKEKIIVESEGVEIDVSMESWENTRYTLNREDGKLQQETLGSFFQYPLRLAWAITIHKSQGLTFDKVMIDAGAAFSSGQVYVALSRCTGLNGIVLLSRIPASAIYSNSNVVKGQQLLSTRGSLAMRFEGARQIFTRQLLETIFSFEGVVSAIGELEFLIIQHRDKLNDEDKGKGAIVWIGELKAQCASEKQVGLKFITHIAEFMKTGPVIENNQHLQQRISDAANHFLSRFSGWLQSVQNHPLLTEHKEAATSITEQLQQLYLSLHEQVYYLQYCKSPFSVTAFLKQKLNYSQPRVSIGCYAAGKKQAGVEISNSELYDTLKRWRDMVVEESGLPIFMVANQASLKEICAYLPLNKKDLQQIKGFGKAKVDKYGDDILEAVESYCSRHDLETNIQALKTEPKKEKREKAVSKKTDTKTVSFNLFREGKTIPEIAKERNITPGTVEGHLVYFIGSGELDINELLEPEKQSKIKAAIVEFGSLGIKTVLEKLPPGFNYSEIRMVQALEKRAE